MYKICRIKRSFSTNLKTRISQRSLRNSSLLLLLFEFNNFSFLIDIDNIIYTSGTCHHNSNQRQCSINVTCLPSALRHQYTALSLEGVLVTWYKRISYIHMFWYNFVTVLCKFVEIGTLLRCIIVLFNAEDSQVSSLYIAPFIFYLQSLFYYLFLNSIWNVYQWTIFTEFKWLLSEIKNDWKSGLLNSDVIFTCKLYVYSVVKELRNMDISLILKNLMEMCHKLQGLVCLQV